MTASPPPARISRQRPGIALFLALGAILVIGVLVVSATFSVSQRDRIAATAMLLERARAAADLAEITFLASAVDERAETLATGVYSAALPLDLPGGGVATGRIVRLSDNLFMLVTDARLTSSSGSSVDRRSALLFRIARVLADSADTNSAILSPVRIQQRAWAELF